MYIVKQGDTLRSMALASGIADWKTIYDAAENAAFKQKCESGARDPNILFPGEEIFIPNREMKHDPAATDARHTFRVPLPPKTKLSIVLELADGTAMADQAWTLVVAGQTYSGTTGEDGLVEAEIAADAQNGTLTFGDRSFEIRIGYLNPLDQEIDDEGISGAQARLANLGYAIKTIDGQLNEETRAALTDFQAANGLTESGEVDEETRKALAAAYRC